MSSKENEIPEFHENERAHPLARDAFGFLRNLNRESQMHVFSALRRLFTDRREVGIARLRATSALERWLLDSDALPQSGPEGSPIDPAVHSTRAYDRWRSSQPVPKTWPSTATIRRAYDGSWSAALAAVTDAPLPIFRAMRRSARGKEFTDKELITALQEWAASTTGKLRWAGYREWALRERALGRVIPMTEGTFTCRFGSRREAFELAGIWTDRAKTTKDRQPEYSRDDLLDALDRAHREMDGRMTLSKYAAFRFVVKAGGGVLPSEVLIRQRLGNGSWKTALAIYLAERGDANPEAIR